MHMYSVLMALYPHHAATCAFMNISSYDYNVDGKILLKSSQKLRHDGTIASLR